jgi:hypothetical protein
MKNYQYVPGTDLSEAMWQRPRKKRSQKHKRKLNKNFRRNFAQSGLIGKGVEGKRNGEAKQVYID